MVGGATNQPQLTADGLKRLGQDFTKTIVNEGLEKLEKLCFGDKTIVEKNVFTADDLKTVSESLAAELRARQQQPVPEGHHSPELQREEQQPGAPDNDTAPEEVPKSREIPPVPMPADATKVEGPGGTERAPYYRKKIEQKPLDEPSKGDLDDHGPHIAM